VGIQAAAAAPMHRCLRAAQENRGGIDERGDRRGHDLRHFEYAVMTIALSQWSHFVRLWISRLAGYIEVVPRYGARLAGLPRLIFRAGVKRA